MEDIQDPNPHLEPSQMPKSKLSEQSYERPRFDFSEHIAKIRSISDECSKVLIGQDGLIDLMLLSILCDGHVLLEGVPGIAKTLTAKVLARTLKTNFSRIQFTPDLMPADIIGTSVFNMKESTFSYRKGPVFSNIILIDEINRAPAKTQSALFEVMEEKQITYDGNTYPMSFPFLIIATQNPVEQEGTYRLPEGQLDRFMMKICMSYPKVSDEVEILKRFINDIGRPDISIVNPVVDMDDIKRIQADLVKIYVEPNLLDYIVKIIDETRKNGKLFLGASPRASLAVLRASKAIAMITGRDYVIPDDIQEVCPHILNHRVILTPEAEMSGATPFTIVDEILKEVEVPR